MSIQDIEGLRRSLETFSIDNITQITTKAIDLLPEIINVFLDNIEVVELAEYYLQIISMINLHLKDTIVPILKPNIEFLCGLFRFLGFKFSNDVVQIFTDIFCIANIKLCENISDIIKVSLDSLENTEKFDDLIEFLVVIAMESPEIFVKLSQGHPNSRYFSEQLLQLLNRNPKKYLRAIQNLLEYENSIFYSNDLKILCDILIQGLENTSELELKKKFLDSYDILTNNDEFLTLNHRIEEGIEISSLARHSLADFEKNKRQSIIESIMN